jgi:RHS repeat-associated protein
LQPFVRQSPTKAKTKIQGLAPTDRLPAIRLSSALRENMKKLIFTVSTVALLLTFGATSALALDDHNPIGVTGAFEGVITTGCAYNVLNHNARREIDDIVVPGAVGKYGLKMTRYYNSRDTVYYGLMGPGWRHEYLWSFHNDKINYPNGNVWDKTCDIYGNAPLGASDWPTTLNGHPAFRLADGGTVVFENPNWAVATKIIDPYGQVTTIDLHPASGLITRVTEPGGRYLLFMYNDPDVSTLLTKVEAYDGQGNLIDRVVYNYTYKSPGGQGQQQMKCLTRVDYSDGQHAYYTYEQDNAPDDPLHGSAKIFPLISTCNDVRYHGPMRRIAYDYQDRGPHGAILKERYSSADGNKGAMVSKIDPPASSPTAPDPDFGTTYTEIRGDGNGSISRSFTYTDLHLIRHHGEPEACPDGFRGPAPQQFLLNYTDFQGQSTQLGYDANWYVNSVTDANGHTTSYTRGPRPPGGIGEIRQIQHPGDNSTINYTYTDNGHYLTQITDERGNRTFHYRELNTHQIMKTEHWDANNNLLAYEEFWYNTFGQLKTHHLPTNALKNGAYVHFQYDNRGLLIKRWNPTTTATYPPPDAEPHTTYTYYTAAEGKPGWVDRVKTMTLPTNVSGNTASETYEYDLGPGNFSRGLVTKIQHNDQNGSFRSFSYDAYGNKLLEENELHQRTSYTYDDYNRVLSIKDPIGQTTGHKTTYTYNPTIGSGSSSTHTTSNPDTITTPAGIQTSNVYDENFRKISTTIETSTSTFSYDNVGNLRFVTDPLLHTTETRYDERNRKKRVIDALYKTTIFGYDPASNVTSITRPDNRIEAKGYDGMNRLIIHTVPKSNTESLTTTFGYWPSGKLFWVQDAKQQGGGPNAGTYFEYNESDEQIRMWYPGRVQKQEWSYDGAHNLASHTTVGGKVEQFTYDVRNRKATMKCGIPNPVQWIEWAEYGYDDVGRLTSAKNGTGAWYQNIISTVIRQYDDAGHLTLDQQNVNGLGTANVSYPLYDDDGKLKQISVPGGGYDYTFRYDNMGRFQFIYPTGNNNALFQYSYDAASNEIQRYNWTNSVAQIYNRDSLNRIWRLELKKGASLLGREDYGYDAMNRLVSTTREDNRQDQYGYYLDGELLGVNYGANPTPTPSPPSSPTPTPPGGQVSEPTFSPDGGVSNQHSINVWIQTATSGAQMRYTTNDPVPPSRTHGTLINGSSGWITLGLGHVTLQAMAFKNGMADSDVHSADYEYDNGQEPNAPDTYRTVVYYYDGAGNRTGVNDNGIITAYTSTPLNQYDTVTGSSISNGLEHEVLSFQGPNDPQSISYTYLTDKGLVSVSTGNNSYSLAYDALGRCVKRTLNTGQGNVTTYYIYDGEKPILEYKANDLAHPVKNLYGKGIDEILMRSEYGINGNQPFYYQQDHEGSVTHLSNASGNVIEKYRYDVFGNPVTIYSNGTYNNRFKFTGREFNSTFGFYEYRARAYHPILGRFMSEDPKLADAGDYNLFRYCHNDPLDLTDPMGLTDTAPTYSPRQTSFERAESGLDLTNAERISLWQKSMESSIGGELAFRSVQFMDTFSRQLGQGSFQDQHMEFRPNGKSITSPAGNPITQGTVIFYVNGKPVATYPANSGGWKSEDSMVAGNDTRTPPGHYYGTNFRTRYDKAGMVRAGVGFSLDLNPLFYTNRTLLRMHPDGPPVGSEGCVALSCGANGLRDFSSRVGTYLKQSPFIDVYVGY